MKKIVVTVILLLSIGTLLFALSLEGKSGFRTNNDKEAPVEERELVETNTGEPTADNPWDELSKLVSSYYGKGQTNFKGSIKLIDDNGDKEKVLEDHSFTFNVWGKGFRYQIDSVEFIKQDAYMVVIDNHAKFISVSGIDRQQQALALFDMDLFRKMMEEQKPNMVVTNLGTEKILTVDSIQHPRIQGYRIYYDPETYTIHRMVIGMARLTSLDEDPQHDAEKPGVVETGPEAPDVLSEDASLPETYTYYLDILYKEASGSFTQHDNLYLSRIFKKMGEQFELTERYKNYQLVNSAESDGDSIMQTETDK